MQTKRNKNYGWHEQLAVGVKGEEVVLAWLRDRAFYVGDVRSEVAYRGMDIDFVVQTSPEHQPVIGGMYFAEVKTDTYDNEYVFFETHTAENGPGALFKSRASVWYIYKPKLNQIIEVQPARVATHLWLRIGTSIPTKLFPVFNDKKRVRAWGVKLSIEELTSLGGMVHLLTEKDTSNETDSENGSTTEASL